MEKFFLNILQKRTAVGGKANVDRGSNPAVQQKPANGHQVETVADRELYASSEKPRPTLPGLHDIGSSKLAA